MRALLFPVVLLLCGACSKTPIGGVCSSDFACDSRAEKCLRLNGQGQDGICSRRCTSFADCEPDATCGRIQMKHVGGIMGKIASGGGTEAWCLPK